MPTITALRRAGSSIAVELDGAPWRSVPVAVVAEASLHVGDELDRHRAGALAGALRRRRAEGVALRSLSRREESRFTLSARLARAGVAPATRGEVLERAESAGLVDDERYASLRARTLAERGFGDLYVLDDLRRQGIDEQQARAAVAALEPERRRIEGCVAARGATAKTLRFLAARGFTEESLEALIAAVETRALG